MVIKKKNKKVPELVNIKNFFFFFDRKLEQN